MPLEDQRRIVGVMKNSSILMMPLLMLLLTLANGCVITKYENAHDLIKKHPKGFKDAVNASPESRHFVDDALRVIVNLEHKIESGE